MNRVRYLVIALLALNAAAQPPGAGAKLEYTVILSRHGARSPLETPEQMRDYSPQPWPAFDAPTGYLTPRGIRLMQLLGAYDREYLTHQGLLASTGCADLDKFYIWSDSMGRDIESAWLLGHALMPTCDVTVHRLSEGVKDPLFDPAGGGVGKKDFSIERAEYLKAMGGSPEAVVNAYRADLQIVDDILWGCKPAPGCATSGAEVKKPIMKQDALKLPENAAPSSPMVNAASTIADAFLLEYLDGMDQKNVAWGRLDPAKLHEMRRIVGRNFTRLTPYSAKAAESNLLSHINRSLEQAIAGTAIAGSIGKPGDKALILLGHDSDMWRIGRILGVTWETEKGLPMEALPNCSLMFEVWRDSSGKRTITTTFQTQTFDQLRDMTQISLKTPPVRVPLTLPGCDKVACDPAVFKKVVDAAIDPAFVAVPKPAAAATN